RLVCRELARGGRDLLILNVDRSRASDPEIAGGSERDRLLGLSQRFSREDLLRAFDLLTRAQSDLRAAAQPRYHLQMALLRWLYLRNLVPIEDLIAGTASGKPAAAPLTRSASPVKSAPVSRPDGRSTADAGPPPRPGPGIDSRSVQPAPSREASTDRAGLA